MTHVGSRAMNARLISALTALAALLTISACDVTSIETQCLDDGSCWATSTTWTAWARADVDGQIENMISMDLLLPAEIESGDECWNIAGTDRHLCSVHINGAILLGSPATEYPLDPSSECSAMLGPWESTRYAYATCFGIMDGVAIELRDGI